jgi:hypothetical protein
MQHAHRSAIAVAVLAMIGACDDAPQPTVPVATSTPPSLGVAAAISMDSGPFTPQSLTLPFSGSVSTPVLPAFKVVQTGNGSAGFFQIAGGGPRTALTAQTNGTSSAGYFLNTNSSNVSPTLGAQTNGSGTALEATSTSSARAAIFRTTHPATNMPTVEIWSSAWNVGLFARSQGNRHAGYFVGSPPGDAVLRADNFGTGPAFVAYSVGGGEAGFFQNANTSSSRPALAALGAGPAPTLVVDRAGTGPIAVFRDGGVNKIRFNQAGKGFFNGGTQTGGADLAEAFEVEGTVESYRPGDVLVISQTADRRVAKSSEGYSTTVIGVYATKPGVLLTERGIDESLDDMVPVGVVGVIPTRVSAENGVIRRGDLLVSSRIPGHAMRADPRRVRVGMVIGKALQEFAGPGSGLIRVLVNVK